MERMQVPMRVVFYITVPLIMILGSCIVRPIMEFSYDISDDPQELRYIFQDPEGVYLSTLREDYQLLSRTAVAGSDLQRAAVLAAWVHGLWEHDGESAASKQDPLTILWEAEEGGKFRAIEYAVVLSGALQAVAVPSRFINLHGKDIEETTVSHVVVEAYMRDLQKWVVIDPRWNRIPMYQGSPLNAFELQSIMSKDPRSITFFQTDRDRSYIRWIRQYLYYMHTNQDSRLNVESYAFKNLMLVPTNLPIPGYYSPYHRNRGFELSLSASITHDPNYFYGTPIILFDDEAEAAGL